MKISLLDMDAFIKRHDCKEITNAIFFNFGNVPTEDGLFSYDIFGSMGSDARKNTFAYINLNGKFLHPVVYQIVTSMYRKLVDCINGTKYFIISSKGEIIEDEEKGETGLDFLYKNWDKIKWDKEDSSNSRKDKIDVLTKYPKSRIFIDKFLVIPPYLRDFKPTDGNDRVDAVDEINDMYAKLIRSCQSIDNFSLGFLSNNNNFTIQSTLLDIYTYLTQKVAHKTGLIHRSLLGKTVDYATRSVISCPIINSNSWKDVQVPFGYTGVPLAEVINLFFPFFIYEIQSWLEQYLDDIKDIARERGKKVDHFMEQFDEDHIKKLMNSFIKNRESRFSTIKFKDDSGEEQKLKLFENDLKRDFTLMDLFYITGMEIIENKHVYVTRYPIADFMNIFPTKIKILTTQETTKVKIGSKYFEDYPLILPEYPDHELNKEDIFIDTCRVNAFYLSSVGGDFDGDTISLRGVFSQEANLEAEKFINSKKYIIGSGGKNERGHKNEGIQALYTLTY